MGKITWESLQKHSDHYLSDGCWELLNSQYNSFQDVSGNYYGNYLISHKKCPYYIGETNDINKRLTQQFKLTTSTFYKNYKKYSDQNNIDKLVYIDDFKVQHIETQIGRKEIEEFGIVNLPTIINSFQLGKRSLQGIIRFKGIWDELQCRKSELLLKGEKEVFKQSCSNWYDTIVRKVAGLYIVKGKSGDIIYIGESSDINERYATHSNRTYFSALRRHIATEILSFELKEKNGKKKYLLDNEEKAINIFLKTCSVMFYPVSFGRYELEEFLIKRHKPLLNRKGNRKDE